MMFVRMVTLPALKSAFDELDQIREEIIENVFGLLKNQTGWIKTEVLYSQKTKRFRTISYWSSKKDANVFDEKEPELSNLQYALFGRFAKYFADENLTVEYFDHLETIEHSKI